ACFGRRASARALPPGTSKANLISVPTGDGSVAETKYVKPGNPESAFTITSPSRSSTGPPTACSESGLGAPVRAPIGDQPLARQQRQALADLERSEEHTSELQSPDHLVC